MIGGKTSLLDLVAPGQKPRPEGRAGGSFKLNYEFHEFMKIGCFRKCGKSLEIANLTLDRCQTAQVELVAF